MAMARFLFILLCLGTTIRAQPPSPTPAPAPAPRPPNYPVNRSETFLGSTNSYSPGDSYSRTLDKVCDFLYDSTPLNGSELYVVYGQGDATVHALSQCYNNILREHCSECLAAARVMIDNNNLVPLIRGGGYWTEGANYNCFLLYDDKPLNTSQGLVLTTSIPTSPPSESPPLQSPPPPVTPPGTPPTTAAPPVAGTTTKAGSSLTRTMIIVGVLGAVCLALIVALLYMCFTQERLQLPYLSQGRHLEKVEGRFETAVEFNYEELRVATGGFSQQNKLGQGGFGAVYKGVLKSGTEVAVKQLSMQSKQGNREFINEISIITGLQHRNLVRLKGYCIEGEQRLLVYEFLENRSLDLALFDPRVGVFLDWPTRYNIVIGIARGLAYLHQDSQMQIIHRDIKASNILLDRQLNPKISDFGISKLFNHDKSFISTKVAGTFGYLAPEYALGGRLTTKADVFSFGVLALEIVSGRKCNDNTMPAERQLLMEWTWDLCEAKRLLDLVDHRLDSKYTEVEVMRVIHLALVCTHQDPHSRPLMSDVVAMLLGYLDLSPLPSQRPRYFGDIDTNYCRSSASGAASSDRHHSDSSSSKGQPSQVLEPSLHG